VSWNIRRVKKKLIATDDLISFSEEHNRNFEGNYNSPFTSWTKSEEIAKLYAGEGGLVLKAEVGPPEQRFGFSPDEWNEQEVLVCGVVSSAEVLTIECSNA
jgi:hypothetical protein